MNLLMVFTLLLLIISSSNPWSTEVEDFKTPLNCYMPCPFVMDPVCATNGTVYKAFNNMCFLKAENCVYKSGWREVDQLFCKHRTKKLAEECKKNCDNHPSPICGFDGYVFKLFWNNCLRNEGECIDGHKWEKVPLENCAQNTTCIDVCPDQTDYVCASNGDTFRWLRNPCVIELENCHLSRKVTPDPSIMWKELPPCYCIHRSEKVLKRKCEVKCKPIYDPVCGKDGLRKKSFANACALTVHNCLNCSNFTTIHPGSCP